MVCDYYFSENEVNENTWKEFLKAQYGITGVLIGFTEINGLLLGLPTRAFPRKTNGIAFNPNGTAFLVSELGKCYDGIWFETESGRRVAIFSSKEV